MAGVAADWLRRYEPPRPVLVLHDDGDWYPGMCEGWVRDEDGVWRASVRYSTGVGESRIRIVPAERVTRGPE